MAAELIAPISEDLRSPDNRMDIIKGIEHVNYQDETLNSSVTAVELGDWLVKGATGCVQAGATGAGNTYPVFVGNDQLDAKATGKVTLLLGGGFIYRTTKYVAGSYAAGDNLTVKSGLVPGPAGGSDAILARVYTAPDAKGVMEILVLNR